MISRDILYKVSAASLEKYLLFNEWVRDYEFPNKKLMVFHLSNEIIAIPSSEKYKDFYMMLPNILETLSDIYDKPCKEIIKEITSSYYDLLEFRIKSKISEDGVLPLGYASECIEGLKDLILYSACAEQNKEPICMRTTNNAKQVLDNFKLAQTDVGSFVINIDIKVADEENEQMIISGCEPDTSIEHKIVKRIGKAIQQIDDVAKQKTDLDQILPDAYQSGVTANMCDALLKLKPDNTDVSIETKIRYASAITQKSNEIELIEIKNNHFYTMGEISKRYKSVEKVKSVSIHGAIKSLKKIQIDKQRYKREIHIITYFNEKYRTIKAELNESDNRRACNAFRDGDEVEIQGILDMSGKVWEMRQVNKFAIVSNREDA